MSLKIIGQYLMVIYKAYERCVIFGPPCIMQGLRQQMIINGVSVEKI